MISAKAFPIDVIEYWPEVFGEITLGVVPLQYLESVTITFKNSKCWEINVSKQRNKDWQDFVGHLQEIIESYSSDIDNIDFKLDTERVKKDIIKITNKFLKKRKLK